MTVSPVSFGTLMCFSLKKNQTASIPDLLKLTFNNNPALKEYNLQDTFCYTEDTPDGTVHNAFQDFSRFLDNLYKKNYPKNSKDVKLTQAEFYINPTQTATKYFVTAATNRDEDRIFKELQNTREFYTASLSRK